jgi:uncharacterized protein
MKIIIAGASGLVGSALVPALRKNGHDVRRLVRRAAKVEDEIVWDPVKREIDLRPFAGAHGVINLAGENLGAGRWTAARREAILRSRLDATETLLAAIERSSPRPAVLLNASAAGFYGSRGEDVVTEESVAGSGFLTEVCQAWEAAAEKAAKLGVRTTRLRFGMILAASGGALVKLLPLFRLGLGGRMGSGQQWMSWVGLEDVVGIVAYVLRDERTAGAINVVAPAAVTNAEFSATLGRTLRRPAVLPVPKWALRLAVGRGMADEALLGSTRAAPRRLEELGYVFQHPTLEKALRAALTAAKV